MTQINRKATEITTDADAELRFNMAVDAATSSGASEDDAILAALLGAGMADEIIEGDGAAEPVALIGAEDDEDETTLKAAVAELERAQANHEVYATSEEGQPAAADIPQAADAAPAAKVKKVKAAKAPAAPKEPKPAAAPRITYVGHTTSEVLVAKLGDKASELLLLEVADVSLCEADLKAKQAALLARFDPQGKERAEIATKVGEKAVMLFSWLKSGGKLNDVMARAFEVLAKDGRIDSGPKGNLQTNLLTKFSPGTAASQANQIQMLFPVLAITVREKGTMAINPNSLIFMKAKAELGLT